MIIIIRFYIEIDHLKNMKHHFDRIPVQNLQYPISNVTKPHLLLACNSDRSILDLLWCAIAQNGTETSMTLFIPRPPQAWFQNCNYNLWSCCALLSLNLMQLFNVASHHFPPTLQVWRLVVDKWHENHHGHAFTDKVGHILLIERIAPPAIQRVFTGMIGQFSPPVLL